MNDARSNTATGTTATAEPRPRGRFAPSPTGPLHQGSLCTALGSWLDARAQGGDWLLRIEDVDAGRARPAVAAQILRTLEAFGLEWDGPVLYQSTRRDAYEAALSTLAAPGLTYPCTCTRRELPRSGDADGEPYYPGTCRAAPTHPGRAAALRLRTPAGTVTVSDRLLGARSEDVAAVAGDFVVRRRDGCYAYQLAVVVDDAAQGITDVVRGADLWLQTPRQRLLQQLLGHAAPRYLHLPLVVEPDGSKLSKSRRAVAVPPDGAARVLPSLLAALGLPPGPDVAASSLRDLLQWAVQQWPTRTCSSQSVPAWSNAT